MPKKTLSKSEKYNPDFIRDISLFSGLTEEEKDNLLKSGQVCSFKRGRALFRQGDILENFYVVCGGIVQLSRVTPGGHALLKKGETGRLPKAELCLA
jgi:CRP-like cAMP-binding protein